MTKELDVPEAHLQEVLRLLAEVLPGVKVIAYGSRVLGKARRTSDLDLVALVDRSRLGDVCELRDRFEDSDIPFVVDLKMWCHLPPVTQEEIGRVGVVVQEPNPIEAEHNEPED